MESFEPEFQRGIRERNEQAQRERTRIKPNQVVLAYQKNSKRGVTEVTGKEEDSKTATD